MILCSVLLFGCSAEKEDLAASTAAPPENTPKTNATAAIEKQAPKLVGYIIEDDANITTALAMHGFLHMAENLGYPAKLYRAKMGGEAEQAVENAIADQCRGLLIQNPGGVNDGAIKKALEAGVKVIVPYDRCTLEGVSANVVADDSAYIEEIAYGLSARMMERSLKSGRILLYYSSSCEAVLQEFQRVMQLSYPQYPTALFNKTAADDEAAVAELADFLLVNRDVKGIYVIDGNLAFIAVNARAQAQERFKKDGAPSPTPENTAELQPGQTPSPTIAPGLLTQISITIYANGLNEQNLALFQDNDIYGLCIEPYYEVSAQSTMMLDKALSGETIAREARVNRPIVSAATFDKYSLIYKQAEELFGLKENDG